MVAASPVQRRLPINVEIVAPLKTIEAARADLRTDENDIEYLIQDKQLLAFDVSCSSLRRKEVRIWPPSIEDVQAARRVGLDNREKYDLDQIIGKILSTQRQHIPLTIFRTRIVVSASHVHNLVAEKLIAAVAGTGNCVNRAPMLVRASLVEFLKSRRIAC